MSFYEKLEQECMTIEFKEKNISDTNELKLISKKNSQKSENNSYQEKYEKLVMLPSRYYSRKEREKIKQKETKILKLKRI